MESTQLLRPNEKKENAFSGWLARRMSEVKNPSNPATVQG